MSEERRNGMRRKLACGVLVAGLALAAGPALSADDAAGFLYGRVHTAGGSTYEGRLRWGTEEAFWGDFFSATKPLRPHLEEIPDEQLRKTEPIRIFGITIGSRYESSRDSRVLNVRFGDIRAIRPQGGERALLVLKNGTQYELDGGSNDLGEAVVAWDASVGRIELRWDRIESIEFLPTPPDLAVEAHRLHGTVKTRDGEFRGFIQWDQDECVSSDELDGESADGTLAIPMGNLTAIERRSTSSSKVVLRDGRELVLDGTNDVDSDNRGIYVDDPRYGRVLVTWEAFERVDFTREPAGSGPGYDSFRAGAPLRGKVTEVDGRVTSGRIVWDLDEEETTEFLDGKKADITYSIPFDRVDAVVPSGRTASRVLLAGGNELQLEGDADVGEGNSGIAVLGADDGRTHIPWDRVQRVDFD
jgi:hypothetical protein